MTMTTDKDHRRHQTITDIVRPLVHLVTRLKFGYTYRSFPKTDAPMIVLANHVTDWDPVFVALTFKPYLYFVSSGHVYRQGFLSKLLRWGFDPIARQKGSTDAVSAMQILRTVKKGHNVCIFAEGDRSWNGETGEIFPSTGRLVRRSGASLVTFRLTGGYLSSPRWSDTMRRGKMHGECVSIVPPDKLKSMTDDEVSALIAHDLYENAYERQKTEKVRFRGKNIAQSLETALYTCPECGSVCAMASEENRFFCTKCGSCVTVDEYGFFSGGRFKTVLEWDNWQNTHIPDISMRTPVIYSDINQELYRIEETQSVCVTVGDMSLTRSALSVGNISIPLKTISAISMIRRNTLVFTSAGELYEIKILTGSARKYLTMIRYLLAEPEKASEAQN